MHPGTTHAAGRQGASSRVDARLPGRLTVKYRQLRVEAVPVPLDLLGSPRRQLRKTRPRDVGDHHVFRLIFRAVVFFSRTYGSNRTNTRGDKK